MGIAKLGDYIATTVPNAAAAADNDDGGADKQSTLFDTMMKN
jgi:hypothetical protein